MLLVYFCLCCFFILFALSIFGCVVVPSVFVFMCAVNVGVLCKFRVVCQRWGY
jgi:hypothetical protein